MQVAVQGLAFELSAHRPSWLLLEDIHRVFRPDLDAAFEKEGQGYASKDAFLRDRLLVVPIWQPAALDLSVVSDAVTAERKKLCKQFVDLFEKLAQRLTSTWADASDPRTGQAMFGTSTTATYNELDGLTQCLKYRFEPFGCCGIVMHPQWKRNAYPVSMFTTATPGQFAKALWDVTDALSTPSSSPGRPRRSSA